ncbi:MAG: CPBP family glutamic-type intramembrane protease [Pseudomonadota bacterium]
MSDAAELAVAAIAFALCADIIGTPSGLIQWSPRAPSALASLALRAFFIPALGEEVMFRGALIPSRQEAPHPARAIAVSTALFTLWHVLETLWLPGAAATFLRADFLALAALLGFLCALLRWRSGSLWTAVALHWLVVVTWQGWFGGPSLGVR